MHKAKIYQPAKSVMQSGKGKAGNWLLEFTPATPYVIDGLMGWSGMSDTLREVSLHFPSKEAAIAYAKKKKLEFEVFEPQISKERRKAYADNFAFGRKS